MSIRRLVTAAAVMALIAGALAVLTPGIGAMAGTLAVAQRTAETAGPDALVVSLAGIAAWAVWSWGALGLVLTAASALPGELGGAARMALRIALPAGARRGAALALGLGLGVAGPLVVPDVLPGPVPTAAAAPSVDRPAPPGASPVPDWPTPPARAGSAPDWPPAAPTAGTRLVVRGDCLWDIASDRLLAAQGRTPTDGEVAAATAAWWRANADVIGRDPDLLLPGQVLSPPEGP